jgi:hypothetical protein
MNRRNLAWTAALTSLAALLTVLWSWEADGALWRDLRAESFKLLRGHRRAAVIVARPRRGESFLMAMDANDSIGSVLDCMDRVEARGGGVCEVEPHSIGAGKNMRLERRYPDVSVSVRQ